MAILTSVFGGAGFGLLVRFWQLGIQKRPVFDYLPAHASYMVGFGILGYYADIWEKRTGELIALKRETIRQNRIRLAEEAEKAEMGAKE